MQDHGSRLLGIDGMVVLGVVDVGHALELEVETIARAACCRWCVRASLTVKERPVVRVRDLPLAGRPTVLCWRKRRYRCEACARTFTETHEQLASRQHAVHAFGRRCSSAAKGAPRTPKLRAMSAPRAIGPAQ